METIARYNDGDRVGNVQLESTPPIGDRCPDKNSRVDDKGHVAALTTGLVRTNLLTVPIMSWFVLI